MILLDGHNRFEIAAKHGGIHFEVKKMRFSGNDREQAKAWILKNQLGRRNISLYDRGVLALKLKPLIQVEAKKRQNLGLKSDEGKRTDETLAKIAGTGKDTIRKVEEIEAKAPEATKQAIRSGQQSINSAWLEIKEKERKQEDLSAKAHLEKAEERHEAMKSSPIVSIDDVEQDRKDSTEIARSKYRELENAIKKILFIGAGEESFTIINKKTIGGESVRCLMNDINKAIGILNQLWTELAKGR